MSIPSSTSISLRIVSWNVLGEIRDINTRWPELIRVIKTHFLDIDLLCLQEAFDLNYFNSNLNNVFPYCHQADKICIYSRHPVYDVSIFDLPRAGWPKVLITLKIKINGVEILIANSHFLPEFNSNPNTNKIFQYAETDKYLREQKIDNMIYVADFNVIDVDEPDFYPGWNDAWKILSNEDPEKMANHKWSLDYKQNKHVIGEFCSRLDRVLFLGSSLKPVDFSLIKIGDPLPSDHFGIICKFKINSL